MKLQKETFPSVPSWSGTDGMLLISALQGKTKKQTKTTSSFLCNPSLGWGEEEGNHPVVIIIPPIPQICFAQQFWEATEFLG